MERHITSGCALVIAQLLSAAGGGPAQHLFSENKGQWPTHVHYMTRHIGGALFIESNAITYLLTSGHEEHGARDTSAAREPVRTHAYQVRFEGAQVRTHKGLGRQPQYENYFIGSDPTRWASHVDMYTSVVEQQLYPGIDLRFAGADRLEYDLLVEAGADASRIAMRYEGQDALVLRNGSLFVRTTAGEVEEKPPVAWQVINGKREDVRCLFQLDGDLVHFAFPEGYDHRSPLTIDPVLVFSSFVGSGAENFGYTATFDEEGHAYGGGLVFDTGYPTTLGALQPDFAGGGKDIGLTKFSVDGSSIIWSTYIGGSLGQECPHSLVVNSKSELYMLGTTGSADFPTTTGCYDNSFTTGPNVVYPVTSQVQYMQGADIVVVHFSADATQLLGSTYIGGSEADGLNLAAPMVHNHGDPYRGEIILDQQQNPVIATSTASLDMPTTAGAPFAVFLGGSQDGYVFSMDTLLTFLRFATFIGGSQDDACYGIHIADNGDVLVTGGTTSTDLPMPGSAFDSTANGNADAFIARFSGDGSSLLSTTYLGTTGYDQAYAIRTDVDQGVLVVGQTHGPYPMTPGKYGVAGSSQFIHKLSADLSTSLWSTVIGNGTGTEDISPTAFMVSECGQIYFCGWGGGMNTSGPAFASTTNGLPVTVDALQSTTDGSDFYLMVLQAEASGLDYATFFGGVGSEHVDGGTSHFDRRGMVFEAVCASSGYPTTANAWCTQLSSAGYNLAIFKMSTVSDLLEAGIEAVPPSCAPALIHFQNAGAGTSWTWDLGDNSPTSDMEAPSHLYTEPGIYTVTLIANDSTTCNATDTTTIQVVVHSSDVVQPTFTAQLVGGCDPYTLIFTNTTSGTAGTVNWNLGDGSTANGEVVTHTYAADGTYSIILAFTDSLCGGSGIAQMPVTLVPPIPVQALFSVAKDQCSGLKVHTTNLSTGPDSIAYVWESGDGYIVDSVPPSYYYAAAGDYLITLLAVDPICGDSDTYQLQVTVNTGVPSLDSLVVPNIFSPNGDGTNDTFFPIPNVDARTQLRVFNRWGMQLYDSGSHYKPWNGTFGSGKLVPDGIYYYILDYLEPCPDAPLRGPLHGYVHVVR